MSQTVNKKFLCENCGKELKPGDYAVKCSIVVCNNLFFCNADDWLSHCMLEHVDRYLGFINKDGTFKKSI